MKKKVYDFFAENPGSTHHMCAKNLGIAEMEALKLIRELRKDGFLKIEIRTLGNEMDDNCSHFYSVCKEYHA